jgi:hypothetical protein
MADLQIESFLVRRYRCPFCPRTASRPIRIREHAARCWSNPAARGCKTCKHFERDYEGGESCGQDVSLDGRPECTACGGFGSVIKASGGVSECPECSGEPAVRPGPIVHCGLWEALDVAAGGR